jgi:hypothetical protein
VRDASRYISNIIGVRQFWNPGLYANARDQATLKLVSKAFGDEHLEVQVEFLDYFGSVLVSFMHWCQGCPCHEEDRMLGRKVSCHWTGLRAPELHDKVLSTVAELRAISANLHQSWRPLHADAVFALNEAAITMESRFEFLNELPYLMIRGRDPLISRLALDRFDSSPRDDHHRVTLRLLEVGGPFRRHIEARPPSK